MKVNTVTYKEMTIKQQPYNGALPEEWFRYIKDISPSFQYTEQWFNNWYDNFNSRWIPFFLRITLKNQCIGFLPFMYLDTKRKGFIPYRRIRFMAYDALDFCFIPCQEGAMQQVIDAGLYWFNNSGFHWNLLILDDLSGVYPEFPLIRNSLTKHKHVFKHHIGKYFYINLDREWTDIERSISRKSIRKKCNVLISRAKGVETLFNPDWDIETLLNTISTLHNNRQKELGRPLLFESDRQKKFLRNILSYYTSNESLFTSWLIIDKQIAAYKVGFVENRTYYAWNTAINNKDFQFSTGKYLTFQLLKHLHSNGIKEYNFMRGEGGEKDKWTSTYRENNRIIVRNNKWWYARLISLFE